MVIKSKPVDTDSLKEALLKKLSFHSAIDYETLKAWAESKVTE